MSVRVVLHNSWGENQGVRSSVQVIFSDLKDIVTVLTILSNVSDLKNSVTVLTILSNVSDLKDSVPVLTILSNVSPGTAAQQLRRKPGS